MMCDSHLCIQNKMCCPNPSRPFVLRNLTAQREDLSEEEIPERNDNIIFVRYLGVVSQSTKDNKGATGDHVSGQV